MIITMEKLINKLLEKIDECSHPIDNSIDYDELRILFKKELTEQLNLSDVSLVEQSVFNLDKYEI